DGGAGVEVVAPFLGDIGGDEDLAGDDAVRAERFLPGPAEGDLAYGRRGLALFERQGAAVEPEEGAAERDGAGRNDDDLAAVGAQRGNVRGDAVEPAAIDAAGELIGDQRRADLDGDPGIGPQGVVDGQGAVRGHLHQGTQCGSTARRSASIRSALSASSAATMR